MSERWLKTGDAVTVLDDDEGAPMAMHVRTELTNDEHSVAYWFGQTVQNGHTWTSLPLLFDEEGIRWARGHDEETVRSLVAASMLAQSG